MGNLIEKICTTCNGNPHTIISSLCEMHYFEWAEEKMYNELDTSTEGLYV